MASDDHKYQRIIDLNIIPKKKAIALLKQYPNGRSIKNNDDKECVFS